MDHQGSYDFGTDVALAFLSDGKPGPLRRILADTHCKDAQRKAAASIALTGALFTIALACDQARARGIRFKGSVPTLAEFRYESSCGQVAHSKAAQRLVDAAVALRRDVPGFSASRVVKEGAGAGDKPAPAPVPAPAPAAAGPLKVEVVAMPMRETASKIRRNQAGEIVSTLQIEADVKQ